MDHRTNTLRISFFARTNKNKMLTCAVKELYIPGFAEGSMVDPRRGYFHFIVALVLPSQDGAWPRMRCSQRLVAKPYVALQLTK